MAKALCLVCGHEYDLCKDCEQSRINPWRKTVCCVEHFQIRQVFLQYRDGCIDLTEAKQMLEGIGQTSGDGLKPSYQEFFAKVFAEQETVNVKPESVEEVVVEAAEEEVEPSEEEAEPAENIADKEDNEIVQRSNRAKRKR